MLNLKDDNELDKLSREAADGFSLDQSPDSWAKVNARLDAEMPEKTRRRYLLFFLLFLVVGSGAFWMSRISGGNSNEEKISENHFTGGGNDHPNNASSTSPKASASSHDFNKRAATANVNESSATNNQIEKERYSSTESANDKISEKVRNNNSSVDAVSSNHQPHTRTTKNKQQTLKKGNDEVVSTEEVTKEANANMASPKNDQPVQTVDKSDKKGEVADAPIKSEPKEKEAPGRDNTRWVFSAVYAPDISTVNFTHTQPAGLNLGVFIDYKLSQKFQLQTGFIYTRKNYKMNGSDYHPPKGTWIDYVNLQEVTGNCSMFDIPVNLRYNAIRKKSSTIFFSAGLSSYLMNNEDYSYYYYYNGAPNTRDRSYPTSDDYLFSVINFSAGFEKKLNKSFSMQVEPFFKQTLTGVGFGSISLNSTGIYFSLRYNPLKPSRPVTVANQ